MPKFRVATQEQVISILLQLREFFSALFHTVKSTTVEPASPYVLYCKMPTSKISRNIELFISQIDFAFVTKDGFYGKRRIKKN